jgi:hypothetical protein
MIIFLVLFLIVDAVVLLASYFQHVPHAAKVCQFAAPLCQYPIPLMVLGVIAGGLLLVQRN